MDLYRYIDRIEAAFDDPAVLTGIRSDAQADGDLIAGDRDLVLDRIATYLADAGQADTATGGWDWDRMENEEAGRARDE
jgi:hypothetical protein